ncbi:MAG: glycosyltransferase [Candidatus Sumerlaeia bacterium]|nr:glycosyltransferase [Candidatus Sumerlaeia bacterium]
MSEVPPEPSGRRVAIFSTADWDTELPTNKHHFARLWARRNRVLFIETLGTRRPELSAARDWGRIGRRLRRGLEGAVKRAPRLWSVSPVVRPAWDTPLAVAANRGLFAASAGRALDRFAPEILWVYSPYAAHLIERTPRRALVYHLVDDLAAVPGADREAIRAAEAMLFAQADLVFCTEPSLLDRAARSTPRAHLMLNVADYTHFSDPSPRAGQDPAALRRLAALPRPLVLFSGQLASHKIDLRLLRDLARLRPRWSFALVGPRWEGDPDRRALDALAALPNVALTGRIPYEHLPPALHLADALLMPYRLTEATRAVFPLKLFEYFGTGRPVVGTAELPSLLPYSEAMRLAPNRAEDWAAALEAAMSEPPERGELRRELARRNTWERRFSEMSALLAPLLGPAPAATSLRRSGGTRRG